MACNDSDRRQWRMQGTVVGAAASKTQAQAMRMLGAATRFHLRGYYPLALMLGLLRIWEVFGNKPSKGWFLKISRAMLWGRDKAY